MRSCVQSSISLNCADFNQYYTRYSFFGLQSLFLGMFLREPPVEVPRTSDRTPFRVSSLTTLSFRGKTHSLP